MCIDKYNKATSLLSMILENQYEEDDDSICTYFEKYNKTTSLLSMILENQYEEDEDSMCMCFDKKDTNIINEKKRLPFL